MPLPKGLGFFFSLYGGRDEDLGRKEQCRLGLNNQYFLKKAEGRHVRLLDQMEKHFSWKARGGSASQNPIDFGIKLVPKPGGKCCH